MRQLLEELEIRERELGQEGPRYSRGLESTIMYAWQMSFEYICQTRLSAAKLLCLMSFCNGQAIPELLIEGQYRNLSVLELTTEGMSGGKTSHTGVEEGRPHEDENEDLSSDDSTQSLDDSYYKDIAMLTSYSLVAATSDASKTPTFSMHRLAQHATRDWLSSQGRFEDYKDCYIHGLCEIFPSGQHENWGVCELLFPHVWSVLDQMPQGHEAALQWASLVYNAA